MNDDLLKAQINQLIRDEIQEGINDYVDEKEEVIKILETFHNDYGLSPNF